MNNAIEFLHTKTAGGKACVYFLSKETNKNKGEYAWIEKKPKSQQKKE